MGRRTMAAPEEPKEPKIPRHRREDEEEESWDEDWKPPGS